MKNWELNQSRSWGSGYRPRQANQVGTGAAGCEGTEERLKHAYLVSAEVDRRLEKKLGDYNDLITGALSRIASLEEELAQCRQNNIGSKTSARGSRSVGSAMAAQHQLLWLTSL